MSNWTKVNASKVKFRAERVDGEGHVEGDLIHRMRANKTIGIYIRISPYNGDGTYLIKPETLEMRIGE
jgi:hypothetical protein